jgi:lysophospholipase L1-like esterase
MATTDGSAAMAGAPSAGATGGAGLATGGSIDGGDGAGRAGATTGGGEAATGGLGGVAGATAGVTGTGGVAGTGGAPGAAGAAGATGLGGQDGGPLVALTVYLAGDSTVSKYTDTASPNDQAGWGQMLHERLDDLATVDNRAVGGRTSRRFIEEGYLDKILASIKPGDYLLVQFGTNDSNKTATYTFNGQTTPYYLDPATDFKTYLRKYVQGARDHQATPVLVTPPPRNSAYCTGGNGTGSYAAAMRELGQSDAVAVVDLNQKAVDYLKAICPSPTPEDFFLVKADGSVDGTHFQEHGARVLAGFVADGIREAKLPLARHLK